MSRPTLSSTLRREFPEFLPQIATSLDGEAWCPDCRCWITGGPAAVVDHHSVRHCAPVRSLRPKLPVAS